MLFVSLPVFKLAYSIHGTPHSTLQVGRSKTYKLLWFDLPLCSTILVDVDIAESKTMHSSTGYWTREQSWQEMMSGAGHRNDLRSWGRRRPGHAQLPPSLSSSPDAA